ncbi:MAG: class I SAM-dependent methyltransferase [Gaiellaceae bacterium]
MAPGAEHSHGVCPWWLGYVLASPVRRLWQSPSEILRPHVREGMTVLEPGPGMGFFTLELARLVGAQGRVIAIDVQPRMLAGLRRRVRRAHLSDRVETRLVEAERLPLSDLSGSADFALAFALVHEVPDPAGFFADLHDALRPGARLLVAEPSGHVSAPAFERTLELASAAGFSLESRPAIKSSRSALLKRL